MKLHLNRLAILLSGLWCTWKLSEFFYMEIMHVYERLMKHHPLPLGLTFCQPNMRPNNENPFIYTCPEVIHNN